MGKSPSENQINKYMLRLMNSSSVRTTLMLVILAFSPVIKAQVQTLSIDSCYQLARANYPLIRQHELIARTRDYNVQNAGKGYMPQISINGQATLQSDVLSIPIKIPGLHIPELSKDQYKVLADINQPLYDGGMVRFTKELQEQAAATENSKLEVELYKLNERINQLFFGVLLLNEQITITELAKKDVDRALNKIRAAIENGVALKSNADVLLAEQLKIEQKLIELRASRKAYLLMLGNIINSPLNEQVVLIKPVLAERPSDIHRPELALFETQMGGISTYEKLLKARNLPKASLFLQAGYGRPAFNMFSNSFDPFYIGGVRVSVPLTGFYTYKNDRNLLSLNRSSIEVQKDVFLFNTRLAIKQQAAESEKYNALLSKDDEIIALRTRIKNTAQAQLENGIIGSNDLLREIDAEEQARQNKLLHEIQLLMAQYALKNTTGN